MQTRLTIGKGLGTAAVALLPLLAPAARPWPQAPALPRVPPHRFRLSDFHAVPDGRTLNTEAFRQAIAAVAAAGGGTLVVGAGDYLTGPIDLCSRINLRLEAGAHLRFSDRFDAYPHEQGRRRALLRARDCQDIIISGAGIIDGQGAAWWAVVKKELAASRGRPWTGDKDPRPRMIALRHCSRVLIENLRIRNAPAFQCALIHCSDVTVQGVRIYAPEASYNTDGIDPINCRRVLISRCDIDTGDDCIALKASRSQEGDGTSDVLITDCTFHEGHGCSLGSGVGPMIRHVVVQRCTFDGTSIGIRYKSSRSRGGLVEDITFTDLKMKGVERVLDLSSYYPPRTLPEPGAQAPAAPVTPRTPVVRHLVIRNLRAEGCGSAGRIMGLPEMPLQDITLDNVEIHADEGLRTGYVRDLVMSNVSVRVTGEGLRPAAGGN